VSPDPNQIWWKADTLAKRLNLLSDERDRLKIRTIGAVDLNLKQRKERRRERDRLVKQVKRRAAGAKPQAQSACRTKPWLAKGISRSKWYADKQKADPSRDLDGFIGSMNLNSNADEIVRAVPSPAAWDRHRLEAFHRRLSYLVSTVSLS
jgi:hypothetical protein